MGSADETAPVGPTLSAVMGSADETASVGPTLSAVTTGVLETASVGPTLPPVFKGTCETNGTGETPCGNMPNMERNGSVFRDRVAAAEEALIALDFATAIEAEVVRLGVVLRGAELSVVLLLVVSLAEGWSSPATSAAPSPDVEVREKGAVSLPPEDIGGAGAAVSDYG